MSKSKPLLAALLFSLLLSISSAGHAKKNTSTLERVGWGSALTLASCATIAPTLEKKNRWLLLGAVCVPIAAATWMPPALLIDQGVQSFAKEFLTMQVPLALGTFGGLFVSEKEQGRVWGAGVSGYWGSFVGRGLHYLYIDSESAWSRAAMFAGGSLAGGAISYLVGTSPKKRQVFLMSQALGSAALVGTGFIYAQARKFRGDLDSKETARMQVAFAVAGIGISTLASAVAASFVDNSNTSASQAQLPVGGFSLGNGLSFSGQF